MFRSIPRNSILLTVLTLALPALVAGQTGAIKQLEAEKKALELIGQLEGVGWDVHYTTNRLNSFAESDQVSLWLQCHYVRQIKSLVNEGLRPALKRLAEIRPLLPAWQQDSIDIMLDSAKALVADTNSAILSRKKAGAVPPVVNSEYRELLTRIYDHAQKLVETSDAATDYAAAHQLALEAVLRASGH
jgi:hypothetical protein